MHIHRGGKVYLPTSTGGTVRMKGTQMISGRGMGSVLLQKGGPGAGSSYSGVDDYYNTTGISIPSSGRGLGSLSKKLEGLVMKPHTHKQKNINFSL